MRAARSLSALVFFSIVGSIVMVGGCGEPDIEPRDGTWNFHGSDAIDDTCMFDQLSVDNPGTFALTNNGDGTFTVDDSQNVFDCTLDGADFSCPSRLFGEQDVGTQFGLDAIVHYNVTVTGSFSTANAMSGRQQIEIECVGADCNGLAALAMVTLPCGWAQDFSASHT